MADISDGERPTGSLLEGLVAAMPDAVVGTDAEFRVTVWNAGAERLYGYRKSEALGRFARELSTLVGDPTHVELEEALVRDGRVQVRATAIPEFFVPEERERLVGEYLPDIHAQGRQAWELTLQHFETGDRIPVSYDGFRVDDPETGEPLALATIMRDLTEQRRLDTILAAVTDGIYALDVGLRFTYVNDEAIEVMAEMLGRSDPTGYGDYHGDVDAVRRANAEDPHRKIYDGTPAVRGA